MAEKILTVEEAATQLRVSQATIRKLMKEGKLASFKVGPQLRVTQEAIDDYIRSQRKS